MTTFIEGKRYRTKVQQYDLCDNLICYICKEYKPLEEYDYNGKNGYREFKDRRCKKCKNKAYRDRRARYRGDKDLDRILKERYYGARDRAKLKGISFHIGLDDIQNLWYEQRGLCALSGIEMTYCFDLGRVPTNVSIDKIDKSKGYIKDNIQLVCMAVNQMKSDLSMDELLTFCTAIIEKNDSERISVVKGHKR